MRVPAIAWWPGKITPGRTQQVRQGARSTCNIHLIMSNGMTSLLSPLLPPSPLCGQLAATVDLLPTFAAVAGTDPPVGVILDGLDMSPILFQNQPVRLAVLCSTHTYNYQLLYIFVHPFCGLFTQLSIQLSIHSVDCPSNCPSILWIVQLFYPPILPQSNRDWYIYFSSGVTKELGISAVRWHQYKAHYNSQG